LIYICQVIFDNNNGTFWRTR